MIPFDSNVRFQPEHSEHMVGPFREIGKKQPQKSDPLELLQQGVQQEDVELSQELQNQLKTLGYMTEE